MIDANTREGAALEFTDLCPLVTGPGRKLFYAPSQTKSKTSYRSNRMAVPGQKATLLALSEDGSTADVLMETPKSSGEPRKVFLVPVSFLKLNA